MQLRKAIRLGASWLLGIIFPRRAEPAPGSDAASVAATIPGAGDAGNGEGDADAIARAASLEAANRRIAELEGLSEEKIRNEAEKLVMEIFPQAAIPGETPRTYARPGDRGEPEGQIEQHVPTEEERIEQLEARLSDRELNDAVQELNSRLDGLSEKFPNMDRFRILGQIAQSGNAQINIDKLAEASHNVETRKLDSYYTARRASEAAGVIQGAPPPVPSRPAGSPVPGEKVTLKNASTVLERLIKEKLGWGRT